MNMADAETFANFACGFTTHLLRMDPTHNFHVLTFYIAVRVIERLLDEDDMNMRDATKLFIFSKTYKKVCEIKTGLYKESPELIYDMLKEELSQRASEESPE